MRGRARGRRAAFDRMPLVARVLEMLWAVQPSLEIDLERWGTFRRMPPSPAASPEGRGRDGGGAGARGGPGGPGGPAGAGDPGSSTRWQAGRDARRRRRTRRQRPGHSSSGAAAAVAPAIDPALRRCYHELGVQVGARLDVVRSAWRRLVREHHPDRHGGDPERQRRGTERLQEINRSYDRLKRWLGQGG
jgi:hypothetical protein